MRSVSNPKISCYALALLSARTLSSLITSSNRTEARVIARYKRARTESLSSPDFGDAPP